MGWCLFYYCLYLPQLGIVIKFHNFIKYIKLNKFIKFTYPIYYTSIYDVDENRVCRLMALCELNEFNEFNAFVPWCCKTDMVNYCLMTVIVDFFAPFLVSL